MRKYKILVQMYVQINIQLDEGEFAIVWKKTVDFYTQKNILFEYFSAWCQTFCRINMGFQDQTSNISTTRSVFVHRLDIPVTSSLHDDEEEPLLIVTRTKRDSVFYSRIIVLAFKQSLCFFPCLPPSFLSLLPPHPLTSPRRLWWVVPPWWWLWSCLNSTAPCWTPTRTAELWPTPRPAATTLCMSGWPGGGRRWDPERGETWWTARNHFDLLYQQVSFFPVMLLYLLLPLNY